MEVLKSMGEEHEEREIVDQPEAKKAKTKQEEEVLDDSEVAPAVKPISCEVKFSFGYDPVKGSLVVLDTIVLESNGKKHHLSINTEMFKADKVWEENDVLIAVKPAVSEKKD